MDNIIQRTLCMSRTSVCETKMMLRASTRNPGRKRFFFSSRRRHTRSKRDWSSDVCSSDLARLGGGRLEVADRVRPERFLGPALRDQEADEDAAEERARAECEGSGVAVRGRDGAAGDDRAGQDRDRKSVV